MRDDQLIDELVELGSALDVPAGDGLAGAVAARLRVPPRRRARHRVWLAAAAVLLALLALTAAVTPAREAVADLFGVGAVLFRNDGDPARPAGDRPVPGGSVPAGPVDRAELQAAAAFPLRLPTDPSAGEALGAEVDHRPPGGLVAVGYASFTLVQVASADGSPSSLMKTVHPAARLEPVDVDGARGWWIDGPHTVGYTDRSGAFRVDTIRQAGPVLLWSADGVTYRIEGLTDRALAERIGESLR